jgi:hypothetical protein
VASSLVLDRTQNNVETRPWNVTTRIAFRFCFAYFGLFCVGTAQILFTVLGVFGSLLPETAVRWILVRPILDWAAIHIFGLDAALIYVDGSGSGDRAFDWMSLACWLVLAGVATLVWSVLDRHRMNYATLHKWFRLFIRFCLAGQMIVYGAAKVIPTQMPFPSLDRLVQPFGSFSPMGVLWAQVGVSPPYEILLGCAELLGGLLLILPRTTVLGALVCLAATAQVFILNMTYDVPVKILSFHLLLLSLVLLAPDFRRLANVFFSNGAVGPSTQPRLFRTRRANRIALAAQVALGLWILVPAILGSWVAWDAYGGGREKSPLYGIWNVVEFSADGEDRPPLLTDEDRLRRVIFDDPAMVTYQHMDDSLVYNGATIDVDRRTIALTKYDDESGTATFTFEQPAADRLVLDGELNGRKVRMSLERLDTNTFTLVNRGFHWVQEYPYNT